MQLKDIDIYAEWVTEIKYDTLEHRWVLKMHPGNIVEGSFPFVADALRKHVNAEIVQLIAEVLNIEMALITSGETSTLVSHARWVCALVLQRRFRGPMKLISESVGYTTHVGLYWAIRHASTLPEVKDKVRKVYQTYPWLYRRDLNIQ